MMPKQISVLLLTVVLVALAVPGLRAQTAGSKPGAGSVAGSAPSERPLAKPTPEDADKPSALTTGSSGQPTLPGSNDVGATPPSGTAGRAKIHDDRSTLMGQTKALPERGDAASDDDAPPSVPIVR